MYTEGRRDVAGAVLHGYLGVLINLARYLDILLWYNPRCCASLTLSDLIYLIDYLPHFDQPPGIPPCHMMDVRETKTKL